MHRIHANIYIFRYTFRYAPSKIIQHWYIQIQSNTFRYIHNYFAAYSCVKCMYLYEFVHMLCICFAYLCIFVFYVVCMCIFVHVYVCIDATSTFCCKKKNAHMLIHVHIAPHTCTYISNTSKHMHHILAHKTVHIWYV